MFAPKRANGCMSGGNDSHLLTPAEGPAARVLNTHGASPIVLVCEHASRFFPAVLDNLGVDEVGQHSHAAWDIGAFDLALELMSSLDAPLVHSCVSRLVYDCNRPPEAPDAIPARSEVFEVPGNRNLSDNAKAQRVREIYEPFRDALADLLLHRKQASVLVTIHSFTPIYNGVKREVELGLLHDADDRVAEAMLVHARRETDLIAELNAPYSATDGVTHTLKLHALPGGRPNVMIEVRNDLIDTPAGVRRIASVLHPMIAEALAFVAPVSPQT